MKYDELPPDSDTAMWRHPKLRHGSSVPLNTLPVSSVESERTPTHSSLAVYNRGGYAGTLTVLREDEELIVKRLLGAPLREGQDGFTLHLADDEATLLMMLATVGTVALSGRPQDDFTQSLSVAHVYSTQLGPERVSKILEKLIEMSVLIRDKLPAERPRNG